MQLRHARVLLLIVAGTASTFVAACGASEREGVSANDDLSAVAEWDSVLSTWQDTAVHIPDSTRVGSPTPIRVTTTHATTCVRSAGTEVRVVDMVAVVRPHDFVGRDMICGAAVTDVVHEASVTFVRTGMATVRVERRGGAPLERRVVVR